MPCRLEVSGEERELDSRARLALYRTAQDALTNIRRHASPDRVDLQLDYRREGTRLVVEDRGQGGAPAPDAAAGGGYLTKDAGAEEIHRALEAVARGGAAIDPAVQRHLVEALAVAPGRGPAAELPDGLTPREAEVLSLIAGGLSNAEIAARLVVSEPTVKSHINHLFAKAGVRDRAQAVAYAYRHHLAEPPGPGDGEPGPSR